MSDIEYCYYLLFDGFTYKFISNKAIVGYELMQSVLQSKRNTCFLIES